MDLAEKLRDALTAANFTWDSIAVRIGESGLSGLARNSTVPAADALDDDPQSTLVRLWMLGGTVTRRDADAALPGLVSDLAAAGLVHADDRAVRADVEIKPYATDGGWNGWVCNDLTPGLDGAATAPRPDHVLGVSPASTSLTQLTIPDQVDTALDLGTGCGVQLLHLTTHARSLVGTDMNPRAIELARLTTALNGVRADLRIGDLYAPVAAESFDLIVTNPPFVMSPPTGERLVYREGSLPGDELVRRVVTEGARRLSPDGTLQVLANWAVTDEPWQERLATWVDGTGCDALIVERERLDIYAYIEVWLSDAGLDSSPDYRDRYRQWLDYFETLGVLSVGMGWINLRRTDTADSAVRIESWPHLVHQPVGPEVSATFGHTKAAQADPSTLLGRRWVVPSTVRQETLGHPTAPDPEAIVIRSTTGFGRAAQLDTAAAAFVSACDGELTAGQIIAALADLLETPTAELLAGLLPRLRTLIGDGLIVADESSGPPLA